MFVDLLILLVLYYCCLCINIQLLSQDSEECNRALVLMVAHTLHITGTFAVIANCMFNLCPCMHKNFHYNGVMVPLMDSVAH